MAGKKAKDKASGSRRAGLVATFRPPPHYGNVCSASIPGRRGGDHFLRVRSLGPGQCVVGLFFGLKVAVLGIVSETVRSVGRAPLHALADHPACGGEYYTCMKL